MAKCPTGFLPNGAPRWTCDLQGEIGDIIADVNFNLNPTQWPFLAAPHGRFEAPLLLGNRPTLLPNRGLYFDGDNDFLRMYEIRLNFQMTIHAWVLVFGDEGHLFSLETSIPHNKGLGITDQELAIRFGIVDGVQKIIGVWDKEDTPGAAAGAFLNNWKILHFRFEDFNATGAT
jgi:hypothetical protein